MTGCSMAVVSNVHEDRFSMTIADPREALLPDGQNRSDNFQDGPYLCEQQRGIHEQIIILRERMQFCSDGDEKQCMDQALAQLLEDFKNQSSQAVVAEGGSVLAGRYYILEELGRGVYGCVSKALDQETGETVAIKKVLHDRQGCSDERSSHVLREVSLLRSLDHPNVVGLKDIVEVGSDLHLVLEYADVDLHRVMKQIKQSQAKVMGMNMVRRFSSHLAAGIFACHCRNIIHRDLKPQNVLISSKGVLKIADFGLARAAPAPLVNYTPDVITLWYRAPEILLGGEKYDFEVDVWSAGCIVAEMATGKALFPGNSEIGTIFKIFELLGTPTADKLPQVFKLPYMRDSYPQWPANGLERIATGRPDLQDADGLDLLKKMLVYDPAHRITSRRVQEHRFHRS